MIKTDKRKLILDYDGTFLPFMPFDSEQFLLDLLNRSKSRKIPCYKKIISMAAIEADKRQLIGHNFKKYYNWILNGVDADILDEASVLLADFIPDSHIKMLEDLSAGGIDISIISCGTGNLCAPVIERKNAAGFFSEIISNYFIIENNKIAGMRFNVLKGTDKVYHAEKMGFDPENVIAVGDGYTDIPLLDWCGFPVFLDPGGLKRKKLTGRKYAFINTLPELTQLLIDCNFLACAAV